MRSTRLLFAVIALLGTSIPAFAQDSWPDRPIRFIMTSAAGGGIDLMARILADGLSRQLPKPVIVENNGGAGGLVATRLVAKADLAVRSNPPSKRLILENLILDLASEPRVIEPGWQQEELPV